VVAAFAAALVVVAGCGGGDDEEPRIPQSGERETTTTTESTSTTAAGAAADGEALQIVVTNDDGFAADGIDTLVSALTAVDGVEVTVVAPATDMTGQGGNTTDGPLTATEGTTKGGYAATAVQGFPADTVRYAVEDLALEPDLVISGINNGQNLGPVVDVSGTVGAARAAVREGIPALAVSQGLGDPPDYAAAAELVVAWLEQNREALVAGELPADVVINLNVPSCTGGELRGTLDVTSATTGDSLAPSNCASTGEGYTDDVTAFANGYATLAEVAIEPAA
jgi:5'-nucleotidase